jgi:hypothetical protein
VGWSVACDILPDPDSQGGSEESLPSARCHEYSACIRELLSHYWRPGRAGRRLRVQVEVQLGEDTEHG